MTFTDFFSLYDLIRISNKTSHVGCDEIERKHHKSLLDPVLREPQRKLQKSQLKKFLNKYFVSGLYNAP